MDRTRPEFIERFPEALGTGVFYMQIFTADRDAFRALALDYVSQTAERTMRLQDAGSVAQHLIQILASPESATEKHFLHPLLYGECNELGQQADAFLWVPDFLYSFSNLITVTCPAVACNDESSAWACHTISPCSCDDGGTCQ